MNKKAIFILGVNGGGKSTYRDYSGHINLDGYTIIDPDKIQRDFNLNELEGGRKAIQLFNTSIDSGNNFILESTLSGKSTIRRIEETKKAGYKIETYFIVLKDVDLHIARIKDRVSKGGHFIPDDTVRRRYNNCLEQLPKVIELSDTLIVMDNSDEQERFIKRMSFNNGVLKSTNIKNNQCPSIEDIYNQYKS